MVDIVKFVWCFKPTVTDKEIEDFLEEWTSTGTLVLEGIEGTSILDTRAMKITSDAKIAKLLTSRHNFNWFKCEFGTDSIREGW